MIVIVGCIVVLGAVLAGFMMAGGHVGALIHLSEFVTIGGASLGALIIMSPKSVMVDLMRCVIQVIKGSPYDKASYVEMFGLLYDIARLVRREGLVGLESHVGSPHESTLFQKYPRVNRNHHAITFLCNALGLISEGYENAQITQALEEEMKVVEREHHAAVSSLTKTADALPGFGIVAAVLGIVITMQAIDGPASEIGHKVGAALVGTFLGILLSYGFFAPMAGRMEFLGEAELICFRAIACAVVAMNTGESPRGVILRARRLVGNDSRPSLTDLEAVFKQA